MYSNKCSLSRNKPHCCSNWRLLISPPSCSGFYIKPKTTPRPKYLEIMMYHANNAQMTFSKKCLVNSSGECLIIVSGSL